MLSYPVRSGRARASAAPPRADVSFRRAAILALCGAVFCVVFLASAASARPTGTADLSGAVAVMASADGEAAPTGQTDDGSVWSYVENLLRRILGRESD